MINCPNKSLPSYKNLEKRVGVDLAHYIWHVTGGEISDSGLPTATAMQSLPYEVVVKLLDSRAAEITSGSTRAIASDRTLRIDLFNGMDSLDAMSVLANISKRTPSLSPIADMLSKRLSDLGINTKISLVPHTEILESDSKNTIGTYTHSNSGGHIKIAEFADKSYVRDGKIDTTILHEIVHALTYNFIENNPKSKEVEKLNKLLSTAIDNISSKHGITRDEAINRFYGLKNAHEFMASGMSDGKLINELISIESTKSGFKNIFEEVVRWVSNLFGKTYSDSIYSNLVETFSAITDPNIANEYKIKPGVSELFESNPELSNAVYEALGFEQDVDVLENNGELAHNEYTKAIHDNSEKLSLEDAIKRAVLNTNSSYLKIIGNVLLSNDKFLKNRKAYIATDNNKFSSALGKNGQGYNSFILSINDPKTIIHEAIHTFTGSIIDVNINERDSLNKFELEFKNKIKELYDIAKSEINDEYGITDEHEFLAEISNVSFINKLKNIPYKKSNIWSEFVETIKNLFKNLFLKTFTINSDIQQKDNEYFLELKFNNGNTQNQYFKTKEDAESFIKTINNDVSLDNVAGQLINEFLKVINYKANQITPKQKQQAQLAYSQYLDTIFPDYINNFAYEAVEEFLVANKIIDRKC